MNFSHFMETCVRGLKVVKMFAPNKLCLFLWYIVGFFVLSVRSSDISQRNDTHSVELNQKVNKTDILEVSNATSVDGYENQNNESTYTERTNFMNHLLQPEMDEDSSDDDFKKIMCSSDTVIYMYEFYRISIPIFVRFIFGIAVSLKKLKRVFTCPVGFCIVLLSNFVIMPLVSDVVSLRFIS